MDLSTLQTLIGSFGFPIAAFCLIFWYMYKEQQSSREERVELRNTIAENTMVMKQILEHFRNEDE